MYTLDLDIEVGDHCLLVGSRILLGTQGSVIDTMIWPPMWSVVNDIV